MDEPVISVISPAIKVHYWQEFYDSCAAGTIPFEIVFVGPLAATSEMPPNFRHIQVGFKPAQCLEIAAREARGEYLVVIPDDVLLRPESLDWSWWFRRHLPPFSVVGMRYQRYGKDGENNEQSLLVTGDINSPILPICGLLAKSDWETVGGIDRRFVASFADSDVYMRCRERGGHMFISPNSIIFERDVEDNPGRLALRFKPELRFLRNQWIIRNPDGTITYRTRRASPVLSLDKIAIMHGNQGNVEGWE